MPRITVEEIDGDLLDEIGHVDAIVNPWNRNFLPRWSLIPRGVSGALKRVTGPEPWDDLASRGTLALGAAVITRGGAIAPHLVHVAGINAFWRATDFSIAQSVRNAVHVSWDHGFESIAMPLIGAGTGGKGEERSIGVIRRELDCFERGELLVKVIRYR